MGVTSPPCPRKCGDPSFPPTPTPSALTAQPHPSYNRQQSPNPPPSTSSPSTPSTSPSDVMIRRLAPVLLALLALSAGTVCGGSGDASPVTTTPTASPTPAPDSIMTPRPNLASTPTAKPSPTPTETPLANQTPASKTTETANGQTMQKEPQSPRPGDEVFDFCQSQYGMYPSGNPEILLVDWTIDAYVQWSPDGSQILFSGPPSYKPGPVALYSVDPAGQSLQKVVPVPDFPTAVDQYSDADNYVSMRKITDVPGRDPVWGDGSTMMYFDIFPDNSKIVYSTCAYTRGDLGLEEEDIEAIDTYWGRVRTIVVSDLDETESPQRAEQGSRWVYNYEIVLSDIDGTNIERLTKNLRFDNFPTVSPDGTKIAFFSGPKPSTAAIYPLGERLLIHTVSTGKSMEIVLPRGVQASHNPLKWSPDGGKIAFVAYTFIRYPRFSGYMIYLVGADGSGLTPITEAASAPAWSPDGRRLAVAVPRGRNKASLYTFAPDGSHPRLISPSLPEPWYLDSSGPWMGDLSWSPDATELLLKDHGYGIPLNGSPPTEYGPPRIPYGEYQDGKDKQFNSILDTSWSPDGSKIATRNLKSFQWEDKPGIVYIQDRDGTNIRSLVEVSEQPGKNIIRLTNEEQ